MFLHIVAFVGNGLATHVDGPNTTGSDLKLYFNGFFAFECMVLYMVQIVHYHYDKLGNNHHVCTSWQLIYRTLNFVPIVL